MVARILHTSDWHLGKKLLKKSRLEEQKLFLNWLLKEIESRHITHLLLAGDIFDTPNPPTDALDLFYNFLKRLSDLKMCQAYIIPGNHDSAQFLSAPNEFLNRFNIELIGPLNNVKNKTDLEKFQFKISENVNLHCLPYFRSYELHEVANALAPEKSDLHADPLNALKTIITNYSKENNSKNILLAHHNFGSYEEAGSEQGLSISGLDSIPLSLFKEYDYLALGHMHNYQTIKKDKPHAIYTGSPIPFRFTERNQKYFQVLEYHQNQDSFIFDKVKIPQFRILKTLKLKDITYLDELKKFVESYPNQNELKGYLNIEMSITKVNIGMADNIRDLLSQSNWHMLSLSFINHSEKGNIKKDHILGNLYSTEELFEIFYKRSHPSADGVPAEVLKEFKSLVNELESMQEGLH